MSADNWGICPNCKQTAIAEKAKQREKVGASYGKVAPDVYRAMFDEAAAPIDFEHTLREDYEIGTNQDGLFYVSYRASCSKCKFDHSFKTEENLL